MALRPGVGGSLRSRICSVAVIASIALLAAACVAPSPQPSASASRGATPPTAAVTTAPSPTAPASASPAPAPSAPAGTARVPVPAAGILVPVPTGWELVPPADLGDPDRRAAIAAAYPGADALLAQADRLGGRAEPVLLAADPGAAARGDALAASLAVLVSQPSVGEPLLGVVARFIADGMAESLGASSDPTTQRVTLPAGPAIRIDLELPPRNGEAMTGVAWVIGAPAGTALVTLIGPADVVDAIGPDAVGPAALAAAIVPDPDAH